MTALSPPMPVPARRLPRLAGPRADGLTPGQRRLAVGAIVAAHAVGVWALLQVHEVRQAAQEALPMFFDLVAPPAPPAPLLPPPARPAPEPVKKRAPPPPAPLITAAPSPAPATHSAPPVVAEPPAPAPEAPPAPAAIAAPAAPAPAAPAPAPAPRMIPPSAVQYLVEPAPEYPRASVRNREAGRVMLRILISEAGVPTQVQLERSSGFSRLDDAAIAAVSRSRFRPPTVDGRPVSGWTIAPIDFSLEK